MARKKTYIYRVMIGQNDDVMADVFMYARNKDTAVDYCRKVYHDKHYNSYKVIKVGVSHTLQETGFISDFEADRLIAAGATRSDKYSERNVELQGVPGDPGDGQPAAGDLPASGDESVQPVGE